MRRQAVRFSGLIVTGFVALAFAATACSSGPSAKALADNRHIETTTTTEAPPPDTAVIKIINGAFRPSILEIDVNVTPFVEWRHEDEGNADHPDPTYTISITTADGRLNSDELAYGDVFRVDFSQLPLDIYRYQAFAGLNRLPGTVDSRPDQ